MRARYALSDTLRYAITDGEYGRRAHPSSHTGYSSLERSACIAKALERLLAQVRRLAFEGVEFLQVREKDLEAGDMVLLVRAVLEAAGKMHVLLSTRLDVALAAGATGVHLGASPGGLKAGQVGQVYVEAGLRIPLVSKACHTLSEVRQATDEGVDLILFGPVFGKNVAGVEVLAGVGVERLREACRVAEGTQIFALGGVDGENSRECVDAGAAGVAGIRLFSR